MKKKESNTYEIEKLSEYVDMEYCNLLDSCYNQDKIENSSSGEEHVPLEHSLDIIEPNFLSKNKFKMS